MNEVILSIAHVLFLSTWLTMYVLSFVICTTNTVDALNNREVERNYASVWHVTSVSVLFAYFNIFMG